MLMSVFLCAVSAFDVAHRTQVEKTQVAINAWAGSLVCLIVGVLWYDHWRPRFQELVAWLAGTPARVPGCGWRNGRGDRGEDAASGSAPIPMVR